MICAFETVSCTSPPVFVLMRFLFHDELLHACRIDVKIFVHEGKLFGNSEDVFQVMAIGHPSYCGDPRSQNS